MKKIFLAAAALILIVSLGFFFLKQKNKLSNTTTQSDRDVKQNESANPLALRAMRDKSYPGSDIKIEETLAANAAYSQFVVSYQSEGLKINALLTVPKGKKPQGGWPVIIFNHGYIAPEVYKTTERYVAYVNAFAKNGYIVFKSDYRGNGMSEGEPEGAYYSTAYATDVLNAISSVKRFTDANPNKIGIWGHSMGGNITLRDLEVSPDIKAAVIWAGVVGPYDDLLNNWHRRVPFSPSPRQLSLRNRGRESLTKLYGTPTTNPAFWNSIDPFYNVNLISAPIQIHFGTADEEVPPEFSKKLKEQLDKNGKTVEIYEYLGADHNLSSPAFELAMERSVAFFDKYLSKQ